MQSERFFEDPCSVLRDVYSFLEVACDCMPQDVSAKNAAVRAQPVSAEIRGELAAWFEGPNQRLYELVGKDFGWR